MRISNLVKHFSLIVCFVFLTPRLAEAQSLQKIRADLAAIETPEQADMYMMNAPAVKGTVLNLDAIRDTTRIDRILLESNVGDVNEFELDDDTTVLVYKTVAKTATQSYRVQYIFLDNKKLSKEKIDSLRKMILKRVAAGENFAQLASEYSMDSNSRKGGDLGWFSEGMMHRQFEEAVREKKTGEVFMVDIPSNQWYYVVRNSHAPRFDKQVTVLYIEAEVSR
jgi:parvulin-like peptidyl-prolyl isomerase